MLEKKWTDWVERELRDMQLVFEDLGMFAELAPVTPEIELPVLSVGLQEMDDEAMFANLTLSPFESNSIEATKLLHMAAEFTSPIPDDKISEISQLIIELNNFMPLGNFNLLGNALSYKYVCAISLDMKCSNTSTMETFSLFSLFAMQFNEQFNDYVKGKITVSDIKSTVMA